MAFVYMVRCADGSLYTGWSNDVEARVRRHNSGQGAKYTKTRRPVALVFTQQLSSKSAALKRERQIKQLSRKQKELLFAERPS